MTFDENRLLKSIEAIGNDSPRRLVVGFSGGMDSSVLLHALATSGTNVPILALHVNHGLHPDSDKWQRDAEDFARCLGVKFQSIAVDIRQGSGSGPEAAARDARYDAFRAALKPGDWLVLAQHQDDQAETMLLNLLRGSGPLGLAGMPALRRLGEGNLARPLLSVSRAELADYALRHALVWAEDPANDDPGMDRNFLRHRVLPTLFDRWPDANRRLARSAMHASDAQALLEDLATGDLATMTDGDPARIRIEGMTAMSLRRQRNLIRGACTLAGLPRPPAQRLETLLTTLPAAAPDAEPRVVWPGAEARRYRGELFLLPQFIADGPAITGSLAVDRPVDLGPHFGRLTLRQSEGAGIPSDLARRGLKLATRQGGECIRISAGGRSQKLKKLLQQEGVLPWMRDLLPLALDGDRLVAVADRWVNADIATTPGYRVVWTDGPAVV